MIAIPHLPICGLHTAQLKMRQVGEERMKFKAVCITCGAESESWFQEEMEDNFPQDRGDLVTNAMITPLGKRLILRPVIDKQSGSIEIPEQFAQSQTGEVVGIGTKIPDGALDIGDVVLFHPNAAWTNIEHEGEQLRVMNEEYVLAVMEKSA